MLVKVQPPPEATSSKSRIRFRAKIYLENNPQTMAEIEESVRISYGLLRDTPAGSADPGEEIRDTGSNDAVPVEQTIALTGTV